MEGGVWDIIVGVGIPPRVVVRGGIVGGKEV